VNWPINDATKELHRGFAKTASKTPGMEVLFVAVNEKGQAGEELRVSHEREMYRDFLTRLPPHSMIAVEANGHYSWLLDEMERSSHHPELCNPLEAKRRMGLTKKTDQLDALGLAILLRNGTLPEVWIPPGELRDQRELLSLRMFLVRLTLTALSDMSHIRLLFGEHTKTHRCPCDLRRTESGFDSASGLSGSPHQAHDERWRNLAKPAIP
jgi:transposase